MLDSRFRQATNLLRILVALIACGTLSHAIAHDKPEAYFFDGMQGEVIKTLCSNEHFLNTAKIGAEDCQAAIYLHVEECRAIVEPLGAELFRNESYFSEENSKKLTSLSNLYVMCLQSKILLSTAAGL